jgi:2-polyprenyl-3-methyl-5-hydroxy-6-metoxy-1,4-benzoquinol methylase
MASSNAGIFAQDKKFWNNYLKGRPQAPASLFDRIFSYHQSQGGGYGTVHDAGAGNGPYSRILRSKFSHVIVSDIVAENVQFAQDRLRTDGFSYRTAKVEEADDIRAGSVDMVFATNVMHFPDQKLAMSAIARQLKPGGTLAAGTFGPALFEDSKLQDLWQRMNYEGGRQLLKKSDNPEQMIKVMARTSFNVAPLETEFFLPGSKRINLNMGSGGTVSVLPPEEIYKNVEPNHIGIDDIEVFEDEEGWSFEYDVEGVKEHMCSFPFVADNMEVFADLFSELDNLLGDGRLVRGCWPAQVILATRR